MFREFELRMRGMSSNCIEGKMFGSKYQAIGRTFYPQSPRREEGSHPGSLRLTQSAGHCLNRPAKKAHTSPTRTPARRRLRSMPGARLLHRRTEFSQYYHVHIIFIFLVFFYIFIFHSHFFFHFHFHLVIAYLAYIVYLQYAHFFECEFAAS